MVCMHLHIAHCGYSCTMQVWTWSVGLAQKVCWCLL